MSASEEACRNYLYGLLLGFHRYKLTDEQEVAVVARLPQAVAVSDSPLKAYGRSALGKAECEAQVGERRAQEHCSLDHHTAAEESRKDPSGDTTGEAGPFEVELAELAVVRAMTESSGPGSCSATSRAASDTRRLGAESD